MYKVVMIEGKGRGLVATEDIPAYTQVIMNHVQILSAKDTEKINNTSLKLYTFKFVDKQDCLLFGEGELINHDAKPNLIYYLQAIDGMWFMIFETNRTVKAGEELTIDYTYDDKSIDIEEYLNG